MKHAAQLHCEFARYAKDFYGDDIDLARTMQAKFLPRINCGHCGQHMRPIIQVADDGKVSYTIPNSIKWKQQLNLPAALWPHDNMIVMIYWCPTCGEIDAEYNQG